MPLTTLKASNFVDDSVTVGKLSTTGTASASTYLRGDGSWQALSGLSGLYNASTSTTIAVTVAASKFVMDEVSQGTISLTEGYTYIFDVSDSTNSSHVLRFATAADAAGSTEYTYGVKALGTPGSTGAKVYFTVPVGAPGLFYYCTAHASMGGTANTTAQSTKTAGDIYVDGGRTYLAITSTSALRNGVWVTTATMVNANDGGTYLGTSNSGAAVGRYTRNEAYNSVTWVDMPVGPGKLSYIWSGACSGTYDAGLQFSGNHWNGSSTEYTVDQTAKWDGAAWTASNLMNTGRCAAVGFGTQSATMICGGTTGGIGSTVTTVESYDGDCWSAETSMGTSRNKPCGGGTSASAIVAGGANSSGTLQSSVELWNGSAWSSGSAFSTARYSACMPGIGNATSLVFTAGDTIYGTGGYTSNTQIYDSTAWSTGNNSLKSCSNLAGGGGSNSGIIASGAQGGGAQYTKEAELYEISHIDYLQV